MIDHFDVKTKNTLKIKIALLSVGIVLLIILYSGLIMSTLINLKKEVLISTHAIDLIPRHLRGTE